MATNDPPLPNGPAPSFRPQLVISWPDRGRAGAELGMVGEVSLAQLMEAAFLLDCVARETRAAILSRQGVGQLVGAPLGILDELRRSGRA